MLLGDGGDSITLLASVSVCIIMLSVCGCVTLFIYHTVSFVVNKSLFLS